jgi:hypothetical protein
MRVGNRLKGNGSGARSRFRGRLTATSEYLDAITLGHVVVLAAFNFRGKVAEPALEESTHHSALSIQPRTILEKTAKPKLVLRGPASTRKRFMTEC